MKIFNIFWVESPCKKCIIRPCCHRRDDCDTRFEFEEGIFFRILSAGFAGIIFGIIRNITGI